MTNKELFNTCVIRATCTLQVDAIITRMLSNRDKYLPVVQVTGVPWWFVAIIHNLEMAGKFTGHLHNGDPLTARTVRVPDGRPIAGNPPFTWQESAIDALNMQGLSRPEKEEGKLQPRISWGIDVSLDRMEKYNGLGYRKRGINSPYLWAGSHHYEKGKFVSDGKFDPKAVSKQIGGAVILKRLQAKMLVDLK